MVGVLARTAEYMHKRGQPLQVGRGRSGRHGYVLRSACYRSTVRVPIGRRGSEVAYDGRFSDLSGTHMSEFPLDDPDGETLPQSDRLQILSPEEYELLWGFPRFTQSDRDLFFTLTAPECEALLRVCSPRLIHIPSSMRRKSTARMIGMPRYSLSRRRSLSPDTMRSTPPDRAHATIASSAGSSRMTGGTS